MFLRSGQIDSGAVAAGNRRFDFILRLDARRKSHHRHYQIGIARGAHRICTSFSGKLHTRRARR